MVSTALARLQTMEMPPRMKYSVRYDLQQAWAGQQVWAGQVWAGVGVCGGVQRGSLQLCLLVEAAPKAHFPGGVKGAFTHSHTAQPQDAAVETPRYCSDYNSTTLQAMLLWPLFTHPALARSPLAWASDTALDQLLSTKFWPTCVYGAWHEHQPYWQSGDKGQDYKVL